MDVGHLVKEMLIYELVVRGIAADSKQTVEQLRAALRPVLKMEKKGSLTPPPYSLEFSDEKVQIRSLLDRVKEVIATIDADNSQQKYHSSLSKLVHLHQRVQRIPVSKLTPEEVSERANLQLEVLCALDSLETAAKSNPELSVIVQDSDEEPHPSPNVSRTNPRPQSTPIQSSYKPPNLEKWNLKFTGEAKSSVHGFIERVKELSKARNISDRQLFESAIELFSGKALNWYRANIDRFDDWDSLSELLCRHFEPPDYKSRLFRDIIERTQDTSEGIIEYLSCMQAMFRRHGGLSDEVQLDLLIRNLSPFYATQLPVVETLEELETECLKLETKKYRVENYVPPSRRKNAFVEPDFAFVDVTPTSENPCHFSNPDNSSVNIDRVDTPSGSRPNSSIVCWNCQNTGHINRNCPNPRKIHCFRCGTPNVTVRACPKCRDSGNGPRGNR